MLKTQCSSFAIYLNLIQFKGFHDKFHFIRPKKKDSCVQVSEVKKIRVGRSKSIFILDYFFITNVQRL